MRKWMQNGFWRETGWLLIALMSSIVLQDAVIASPGKKGARENAGPRAQYSLAVLPLEATGRISAEEAAALTDQLRAELMRTQLFTVLEQATVEATLQNGGLPETGCSTIECGTQAGRLLAAQLVVNGSVRKVGQLFFIEVQMIHVNSGQLVQKVNEDFDGNIEQLKSHIRVIARKLVGKSGSSSSSSVKPVSTTQPAQELTPAEQSAAAPEMSETETTPQTPQESAANTGEVKRGSNKLLLFGLVAAGAVGAGVLISQAAGKDDGAKDNKPGNNSANLPTPPAFP